MTSLAELNRVPRVALYARISTNDDRQNLESQLQHLRQYAGRMSWQIAQEFTDAESGASSTRAGLDQMMKGATRRRFDVVLVFDLSRLTRGGPASAFGYIERLNQSGVEFWSATEEHFRSTGAAGPMLIAIAAYIAQQERATQQARVRAGLERARKQGKVFGRARQIVDLTLVKELLAEGKSVRQIANILKVGRDVAHRRIQEVKKQNPQLIHQVKETTR